ncbi:MAG: DNA cytosine methyltransferase [Propionibacteriaceae bacterium]|jgi:DNA (cytosine-5)-methyltransferase 1|nr:DNA cytosine methyltransferase [Propionibacteriaceae bacterium]
MAATAPRPTVVDLFCGAGGLSEGLSQAGFNPVAAVDFDHHAAETYRVNHPGTVVLEADVTGVTGQQLLDLAGITQLDLLAGGPSCQGFSTHGKRIQDDSRNFLFKHFVRLTDELRPSVVLMENVKGMLTYGKGTFRRLIEAAFEEIGYRTSFTQVLAADFGVPQLRNRVLFIGTRDDSVRLRFPEPTHGDGFGLIPYVSVKDALSDLPLIGDRYGRERWRYASDPGTLYQRYCRRSDNTYVTLHSGRPLSLQAQKLASHIPQGKGIRAVPSELLPKRFKIMRTISNGQLRQDCTTLYHRLDPARPAYTITCNYRNIASGPFLNPWEDRSLSHREAARLMSFPDDYQFVGSHISQQIGNAVPPLLGRAVGLELLSSLEKQPAMIEGNSEQ